MEAQDITRYLDKIGISYRFVGDKHAVINGYSSLYRCRPDTIVWARDRSTFLGRNNREPESFSLLLTSFDNDETDGICAKIMMNDPREAFFKIIDHFWPSEKASGISATAVIHDGACLEEGVIVGDGCVISGRTTIGSGTRLGCRVVTIGSVKIGKNCTIQSGVVIGEDGMALVKDNQFTQPIPHYGGVEIGDRVYVGANSCICRGTIEDTLIKDDVKIDALCQISHNCVVDERTRLMAGTILLGGVEVGKDTVINSALIKDQKTIGDRVIISHGAVVSRKLPDDVMVPTNPMTVLDRT
jgi:UDP-3-O-[3-hydroxymyristoyl] glucosamine N-acyltransferase